MSSLLPPNFSHVVSSNVKVIIDYITPYVTLPTLFFMGIVGVFMTFGLFFLYKKYGHRIKILEKFTNNGEKDSKSTDEKTELIMFYADWCPHCKTAMPEWDNLVAATTGPINGRTVVFTKINCAEENEVTAKLIADNKIESFPTIKLFKGNEVYDFDAKPTKDTLLTFLNSVL
jgi:thiol-disulfide isomerase/thioredoxin